MNFKSSFLIAKSNSPLFKYHEKHLQHEKELGSPALIPHLHTNHCSDTSAMTLFVPHLDILLWPHAAGIIVLVNKCFEESPIIGNKETREKGWFCDRIFVGKLFEFQSPALPKQTEPGNGTSPTPVPRQQNGGHGMYLLCGAEPLGAAGCARTLLHHVRW